MRNQRNENAFTLVELLVVVGIIALLIAVLLPALNKARAAAQSVACMSNLRQVGIAQLGYAKDYGGWSTPLYDRFPTLVGITTFKKLLFDGKYLPTPKPGGPSVLLCPTQKPQTWPSALDEIWQWGAHYGMRWDDYSPFRILGNRVKTSGVGPLAYPVRQWSPPVEFLFMGDTVWDDVTKIPFGQYRIQNYTFNTTAGIPGDRVAVHLRHARHGNFLFGDGHVESLIKQQLLGRYGSPDGSVFGFTSNAIDESREN